MSIEKNSKRRAHSNLDVSMRRSFTEVNTLPHNKSGELRVEDLIDDPIGCGFLLRYCRRQHADENLTFVIDVSRFRDIFAILQGNHNLLWSRAWQEVDKDVPTGDPVSLTQLMHSIHAAEAVHKMRWSMVEKLCVEAERAAQRVYALYIADDAPTQICMSTKVYRNTLHRMNQLALYGPDVFAEACLDPILTLCKDIMPRFIKTDIYRDYKQRLLECASLPLSSSLSVSAPAVDLGLYAESDKLPTRRFTLEELLREGFLYGEFLDFLKRRVCAENLQCYRLIVIYEDAMLAKDYIQGNELGNRRLNHCCEH